MHAALAAAVLHLAFVPSPAFVPAAAKVGTVVSTAVPYWSNGQPFRGVLLVTRRNPAFRLVGRQVLVASRNQLLREMGTTQQYTVLAVDIARR